MDMDANVMTDETDHVWLPPTIPTIADIAMPDDRAAAEAVFAPTWWSQEIAAKPSPPRLRGVVAPDFQGLPFIKQE